MIAIESFEARHVGPAARLFAATYARRRAGEPLFPKQFDSAATVEPMLGNLLRGSPGAVAYVSGRFAGYLVGHASLPEFFGRGMGVYVPVWGHCVAPSHDAVDILAALYGWMSAQWVERQCHNQAISYFVTEEADDVLLEQLLFELGFGLQVIDGLRGLYPVTVQGDDRLDIQPAGPDELEAISALDGMLREHLRAAPIFLNTSPASSDELPHSFLEDGARTLLAWRDGVPIAGVRGVLNRGPGCDLFSVDGTLGVNFAFTSVAERRSAVASRLLDALLQWGRDQGMQRCAVDFESANLPARRFWARHFRTVCRSVIRKVDDRT